MHGSLLQLLFLLKNQIGIWENKKIVVQSYADHIDLYKLVQIHRGQDSMAPNFIQNITHCRSVTMNLHGSTMDHYNGSL